MSGKKSKQRGKGFEYRVRDWFRKAGFKADRVPVSKRSQDTAKISRQMV